MTTRTYPWTPVDPLGEALHALRMSGLFYCRSELSGRWGLEMPAFASCLSFHVVTSGGCWLEVPVAEGRYLRPGDVALVPHGRGHLIRSHPQARIAGRVDLLPQEMISDHYSVLRLDGAPEEDQVGTLLVCGIVQFEHPTARRLLGLLPSVIHIDGTDPVQSSWIRPTLTLMAEEAGRTRPGGEAVITRLADVLVIQGIRSWLESEASAGQGWLYALQDAQIGRALGLIHRRPEVPWTVAGLAQQVAMSRSSFAARFTALVGEPVMHYVARWRMDVAESELAGGATVAELASRLGYESEASFARAFKRIVGQSPGVVARRGRPQAIEGAGDTADPSSR